jgi:hypothetical protein
MFEHIGLISVGLIDILFYCHTSHVANELKNTDEKVIPVLLVRLSTKRKFEFESALKKSKHLLETLQKYFFSLGSSSNHFNAEK